MAHAYDEEEDEDVVEEEDEEEEGEDPDVVLARIEKAFRTERARIRASVDIGELRALRSEYQALESNARMPQAARIRARDLVELIDDRVTDIKAKRLADRRG
jgi:hypothetical protein